MTGPCGGKVPVKVDVTFYDNHSWKVKVDAYIHVKGYALARITHLDLESEELEFDNEEKGYGAIIVGKENGFVVVPRKPLIKGNHRYTKIKVNGLDVVKKGERIGGYLGLKEGGIFIGFKKEVIQRLEEIARKLEPDLFENKQSTLKL
nr:hypothetical protein [Candidatus Baldrarchaeota archaeon]